MGTQVEETDTTAAEGQVEETTEGTVEGESGSKTSADEGWSVNEVPPELRQHVERALKPFHSRTTKAEMRAAEFEKKFKELEPMAKGSEEYRNQVETLRREMFRVVSDDDYRQSIRSRFGINSSVKTTGDALPEGWNDPSAVQARNLLFNEVVQGIEKNYG